MAKLDVIIPVYNVEKHIKKCLDSVLVQTLEDIEIICIDDGSIDNCAAILKEYEKKDSRITVITQKNKGLAGARNTGIKHSKSEFIMFLDSDDYYHPQMCEKMYNAIVNNSVDIAICGVEPVCDVGYQLDNDWGGYLRLNFEGKQEITRDIIEKTNVVAWNKIYKRSLIEKYNITFPPGLIFEDNPFFFSYMNVSKNIFYLNEKLYFYVRHSNTIMAGVIAKKSKKKFDLVYTSDHYFKFLNENNLFKKNQKIFWIYYLRMFDSCNRRLEEKDRPELIKICTKFLKQFEYADIKLNTNETNYELLCNIKNSNFKKLFNNNQKKEISYKLFGHEVLKTRSLKYKNEFYVLGLQVLKTRDVINYKEICILNKRVFEKFVE